MRGHLVRKSSQDIVIMQQFDIFLMDTTPQYTLTWTCNNRKHEFLKKSFDIHEPIILDMIA